MPVVDKTKCVGCQACIRNCPVGAISLQDGKAYIDQSLCIKCGSCVQICPVGAVQKTKPSSSRSATDRNEQTDAQVEQMLKEYKEYADKNGYTLNTDSETVKRVVKGLLKNEAKYGLRYCPCRFVSGNKEQDKKNICPCVFHKEEIETQGCCHCKLLCKRQS